MEGLRSKLRRMRRNDVRIGEEEVEVMMMSCLCWVAVCGPFVIACRDLDLVRKTKNEQPSLSLRKTSRVRREGLSNELFSTISRSLCCQRHPKKCQGLGARHLFGSTSTCLGTGIFPFNVEPATGEKAAKGLPLTFELSPVVNNWLAHQICACRRAMKQVADCWL